MSDKYYLKLSVFLVLLKVNPYVALAYSWLDTIYSASKTFVLISIKTKCDDLINVRREMNARKEV